MPLNASGESSIDLDNLHFVHGLRALFATFVVIHHTWLAVWPIGGAVHPPRTVQFLCSWLVYGHFAVSGFIVVSGFCLGLSVLPRPADAGFRFSAFMLRRTRRIAPPYWAALLLSVVLLVTVLDHPTGTYWDLALPFSASGAVIHALLMQDFVSARTPNPVFWSIAVEWHLYLIFPLIVRLWRRAGSLITLVVFCAISAFAYQELRRMGWTQVFPQYLALFTAGFVTSVAVSRDRSRLSVRNVTISWWWPTLFASVAVVATCNMWGFSAVSADYGASDWMFGATIALLLAALFFSGQSTLGRRLLEARPLVAVGAFSYSLYLIHFPVLQLVWQFVVHPWGLGRTATFAALLPLELLAALTASFAFSLAFERPFLSRRARLRTGNVVRGGTALSRR